MDPLTFGLMRSARKSSVLASGIKWEVLQDSSATLAFDTFFSTTGNSQGYTVTSNALPALTTTGWYIDVSLLGGYLSQVAWLGIANTQAAITSSNTSSFTGWYWSGSIWTPSGTYQASSTLNSGNYRIAAKIHSNGNVPAIYYRGPDATVSGPHLLPQTSSLPNVYLMVMGQSGSPMPGALISNGIVFEGGGGLF